MLAHASLVLVARTCRADVAACCTNLSQLCLLAMPCTAMQACAKSLALHAELADQAEQRRQTALTAERRPDTVHLRGVDLMSTTDCLHFFEGYSPASVEWLNDTSCE